MAVKVDTFLKKLKAKKGTSNNIKTSNSLTVAAVNASFEIISAAWLQSLSTTSNSSYRSGIGDAISNASILSSNVIYQQHSASYSLDTLPKKVKGTLLIYNNPKKVLGVYDGEGYIYTYNYKTDKFDKIKLLDNYSTYMNCSWLALSYIDYSSVKTDDWKSGSWNSKYKKTTNTSNTSNTSNTNSSNSGRYVANGNASKDSNNQSSNTATDNSQTNQALRNDAPNSPFKKFNLSDRELRGIAHVAQCENSQAIEFELSLIGNLCERNGYSPVQCVKSSWFRDGEARYNNYKNASDINVKKAKAILNDGIRTLPCNIVEHDTVLYNFIDGKKGLLNSSIPEGLVVYGLDVDGKEYRPTSCDDPAWVRGTQVWRGNYINATGQIKGKNKNWYFYTFMKDSSGNIIKNTDPFGYLDTSCKYDGQFFNIEQFNRYLETGEAMIGTDEGYSSSSISGASTNVNIVIDPINPFIIEAIKYLNRNYNSGLSDNSSKAEVSIACVKAIQSYLINQGENIEVTGIFDDNTVEAWNKHKPRFTSKHNELIRLVQCLLYSKNYDGFGGATIDGDYDYNFAESVRTCLADVKNNVDSRLTEINLQLSLNLGSAGSSSQQSVSINGSNNTLVWPLDSTFQNITSKYGPRIPPKAGASSFHQGIDIKCPSGTKVYAAHGGVINNAGSKSDSSGYHVILKANGSCGNIDYTKYMHLRGFAKQNGDTVKPGEVIGYSDNTGNSSGSHLHFQINLVGGNTIDPQTFNYLHMDKLIASIQIK